MPGHIWDQNLSAFTAPLPSIFLHLEAAIHKDILAHYYTHSHYYSFLFFFVMVGSVPSIRGAARIAATPPSAPSPPLSTRPLLPRCRGNPAASSDPALVPCCPQLAVSSSCVCCEGSAPSPVALKPPSSLDSLSFSLPLFGEVLRCLALLLPLPVSPPVSPGTSRPEGLDLRSLVLARLVEPSAA